ncbi:MAG: hypothetical protein OXH69_04185 [Acidobacteria bacterium]|nr:hypothetical protein [Acidobacteriota bacterium]
MTVPTISYKGDRIDDVLAVLESHGGAMRAVADGQRAIVDRLDRVEIRLDRVERKLD